ncbi:MAG: glycosyltransferase family 2 protein [Paludibacter sp.]|nr:glycosyltransferase family 2 protein [Paludibacter sp.]
MSKLHIITPVKDSLDTTLRTIDSIMKSKISVDFNYTIYNDFSSNETTEQLQFESDKQGFNLVNLKDITSHPSPNYLLVLQMAQQKAIDENAHLLIIESDVIVEKDTIQKMVFSATNLQKSGMIAAVTTDENHNINFPYLYAQKFDPGIINTRKRLSFCCTLMSTDFLTSFDFKKLNPEKSWYDVFISHKSVELGFQNYLLTSLPVLHLPHSSRPWKQLKYTNPLKYYWRKLINKRDKI